MPYLVCSHTGAQHCALTVPCVGSCKLKGTTADLTPKTEDMRTVCPYCGEVVVSTWVKGRGCLPSADYCLVADWVFHQVCWEKQTEENPP